MEAYFPVVAKARNNVKGKGSEGTNALDKKASIHHVAVKQPGNLKTDFCNFESNRFTLSGTLSSSEITRGLLKTLSDVSNPITHSDIYQRSDHIVSSATGHQVSEGRRDHSSWMQERSHKLRAQRDDTKVANNNGNGILKNVSVYIDGYLESTTDIEMKRLVVQAGGEIVFSASRCTHIVTSRPLSGSKTERLLTRKTRNNVYVVKPEWILDSIAIGKRRPERSYIILKASNSLAKFLEQ